MIVALSELGSTFSKSLDWVSSVVSYIVGEGHELLFVMYVFPILFMAIALIKRLRY